MFTMFSFFKLIFRKIISYCIFTMWNEGTLKISNAYFNYHSFDFTLIVNQLVSHDVFFFKYRLQKTYCKINFVINNISIIIADFGNIYGVISYF